MPSDIKLFFPSFQAKMVFLLFLGAILTALTIHEFAHAFIAYRLGDPAAKFAGRLSLNPLRHLDLVGSVIVPLLLYFSTGAILGWGKPVPVNPYNFKNPLKSSALVSLAGPLSNLATALLLAAPLKYLPSLIEQVLLGRLLIDFLYILFDYSLFFFIFNMLPFPPLDGSKILGLIIPQSWHQGYDNFLANGQFYFAAFVLFDLMVLSHILGFSIFNIIVFDLERLLRSIILIST